MINQLPPHNLEAETGVLGSVMMDQSTLDDIQLILKAEDFYRDSHQTIYRTMCSLRDKHEAIDMITVEEELRRQGELEKAGGMDALFEILNSVPHAANATYYAQIVSELAVARDLIAAAHGILQDAYSRSYSGDELTAGAEQRIFAVSDSRQRILSTTAAVEVPQSEERVRARLYRGEGRDGIPFGLADLDEIVSLVPTEMVIIGARPSMGKTAIALNVAEAVIDTSKSPVLFVSLEMGRRALADRLLSARSRVEGWKIQNGDGLRDNDLRQLTLAAQSFSHLAPLIIDDAPTRTVSQIAAQARRAKLRHGTLGLVVIDYAQLIIPEGHGKQRHEQLSEISRRVKGMAREIDAPVILLSQLNRESAKREDKRPQMADLRESGAFEQDADVILLLHRPEYYDPNDSPGVAEIIVAKNRNGATGTVKTVFRGALTRFDSLAREIATA